MKHPLWSHFRSMRRAAGEWLEWALWIWLVVIAALALDAKPQSPSPQARLGLDTGSQAPRLQAKN